MTGEGTWTNPAPPPHHSLPLRQRKILRLAKSPSVDAGNRCRGRRASREARRAAEPRPGLNNFKDAVRENQSNPATEGGVSRHGFPVSLQLSSRTVWTESPSRDPGPIAGLCPKDITMRDQRREYWVPRSDGGSVRTHNARPAPGILQSPRSPGHGLTTGPMKKGMTVEIRIWGLHYPTASLPPPAAAQASEASPAREQTQARTRLRKPKTPAREQTQARRCLRKPTKTPMCQITHRFTHS
jgi:hypothetical protein